MGVGRTWQGAVEGFLAGVASHVCAEGVGAGVRLAFAGAVDPLTRVPLLSAPDVLIVEVRHQPIHVAEVTCAASVPSTNGDLIGALTAVVIFLVGAQESKETGRVGDVGGAVRGD
jgi:hypothetical protein